MLHTSLEQGEQSIKCSAFAPVCLEGRGLEHPFTYLCSYTVEEVVEDREPSSVWAPVSPSTSVF